MSPGNPDVKIGLWTIWAIGVGSALGRSTSHSDHSTDPSEFILAPLFAAILAFYSSNRMKFY